MLKKEKGGHDFISSVERRQTALHMFKCLAESLPRHTFGAPVQTFPVLTPEQHCMLQSFEIYQIRNTS